MSASISLSNFELCSALCRKSSKDLIEHQKIHTEFCFDLKTLNDTIKLRKENNFEITKGSLRIQ